MNIEKRNARHGRVENNTRDKNRAANGWMIGRDKTVDPFVRN
jgi:hypothetical protein